MRKGEPNVVKKEMLTSSETLIEFSEYKYDDMGNLSRNSLRDPQGKLVSYCDFEYDNKGNRTRQISRWSDGTIIWDYTFKYSDKGRKTEIIMRDGRNRTNETWEYKYNERGDCISEERKNRKGKIYQSLKYSYDEGKLVKITQEYMGGLPVIGFRDRYTSEFEYDDKGNPKILTRKDSRGRIIYITEYHFDRKENLTMCAHKDSKGSLMAFEWYDNQGRLIKSGRLTNLSPGISAGYRSTIRHWYKTEYSYDNKGDLISEVTLDEEGKPGWCWVLGPQKKMTNFRYKYTYKE